MTRKDQPCTPNNTGYVDKTGQTGLWLTGPEPETAKGPGQQLQRGPSAPE